MFVGVGVVGLVVILVAVYFIGQASKPKPKPNVYLEVIIYKFIEWKKW